MIPIIFSDPQFIAVNKPSGVLTISTFGVPSVQTLLRQQLATPQDTSPFVEPPHRLDRGTTGVLLIARTQKTLSSLSQQFHHRQTRKRYLIAISTEPTKPSVTTSPGEDLPKPGSPVKLLSEEGTLEDWVRKIPDVAQAEIASQDMEGAKKAILHYRTIYIDENARILQIEMATGRMHQIRVQFGSRGFPVLGDKAYGSPYEWAPTLTSDHEQHTALHAEHLAFRHPKDASWIAIDAPLPDPWRIHFPQFYETHHATTS